MVVGGTLVGGATEGAFYTAANLTNGEWNADDYWKAVKHGLIDGFMWSGLTAGAEAVYGWYKSGSTTAKYVGDDYCVSTSSSSGNQKYSYDSAWDYSWDLDGGGKTTDYYIGPNGKVLPSKYKDWIGTNMREELLSRTENPQLKNAIKQLYRGKSFIGDGGTADVIRFEKETGIMLGKNGGSHIQKGIDMASYIKNKILTQNLSNADKTLAKKLLDDLNNALGR